MADKNYYINFERATRVNSDGSRDASTASLYYQEVPNWTIKFINESQTAVDVSGVTSWAAAVDDDFDDSSTPWVRILDADIDSTDAANGNITIPVDSNTATFLAGIGESEYKEVYFELRGLNGSAELTTYVRFKILARNTLDPSGGVPPDPVGNYFTKAEVTSLLGAKVDVAGDTMTGALTISATTEATSKTTGALIVSGGMGIAKDIAMGDDKAVIFGDDLDGGIGYVSASNDIQLSGADFTVLLDHKIVGDLVFDNSGDMVLDSSANDFVFKENANTLMTLEGDKAGLTLESNTATFKGLPNSTTCELTFWSDNIAASGSTYNVAQITGTFTGNNYTDSELLLQLPTGSDTWRTQLRIKQDDALSVEDVTNYETLVTADDDIPNKKYVDDLVDKAYAEMYQTDNAVATTINTVNVWDEVDNFSEGETSGWTFASSDLTCDSGCGGLYHIDVACSALPASVNKTFEFAVSIDNVIQTKTKMKRYFSSTTAAGAFALNGILSLADAEVIKLEVRNISDATNLTIENCNLTLEKI